MSHTRRQGRSITGVVETLDIRATLEAALDLHPGTREVVVITDATRTGRALKVQAEPVFGRYRNGVTFTYWEDLPIGELEARARKLDPDTIVFPFIFSRDEEGRAFSHERNMARLADDCPVPIYSVWEFYLGHGICGGLLTSGEQQGRAAGRLALRVLDGERASEIPVLEDSPNRYVFDYARLKRFGVDPSELPEGSVLINGPPPGPERIEISVPRPMTLGELYRKYRQAFWSGAAAFLVLVLLVAFLALNVRRRRRAERDLRRERDLVARIARTSPAGITVVDRHGRLTFANAAAERVLGLRRDTITSRSYDDPAWRITDYEGGPFPEEELPFERVRKTGEPVEDVRHAIQWPDGRRVLLSINATPLRADDGGFDGIVAVVTDVTRQVRHEEQLRASEERFSKAFHTSGDSITISRASDGSIVDVNEGFVALTGYSRQEALGKTSVELGLWSREARDRFAEQIRRDGSIRDQETEFRTREDVTLTCLLSADAIELNGEPHIVTTVRDITEQRNLEEQLRQAQKMEAIGRLAGGIAHDFNNQLTVILGYCDLLLQGLPPDHEGRAMARQIRQAGERSRKLTHQLLAFGRRQVLRPEPVSLDEVVSSLHEPLSRMIGEDIELKLATVEDACWVHVDTAQLQQALMNMVINARDAMPEGGTLTIETAPVELGPEDVVPDSDLGPGRYAMLSVIDTGTGMAPDIVEQVFEPFFTTKEVGKGTGLGLSMVYGFVKQSDGAVEVTSEPGEGTCFRIYLPRIAAPEASKTERPSHPAHEAHGTVLVVEDDEAVRRFVVRILRRAGYTVLEAATGRDARPLGRECDGRIDLLVTDVVMPNMSGVDLAAELRSDRPELPVLFISGYPDDATVRDGNLRTGENVLIKPFNPGQLLEAVGRLLPPGR